MVARRDDAQNRAIALKIAMNQYDEAIAMMTGRKFASAEGANLNVAEHWTEAHLYRGQDGMKAGKYQDALADFQAAVAVPENLPGGGEFQGRGNAAEAAYWTGAAYEALGDHAKALEAWNAISTAVAFFERRRVWNGLEPLGVIGVISDFAGPNETTSQEVLNLIGRRSLAYRILESSAAATASLAGFKALIYVDEGAPAPPLRRKLLVFANQGGLLVVGAAWGPGEGAPTGMDHPRVDVRRLGKGRLAICKTSPPDPFMIARDVHMLLGRTYDVARFFNLSAFLSYCAAAPDRTLELVQIVSFAIRFPNDVATVWVPGKYISARLWSLGSQDSSPLEMVPENGGTSLLLPPVPVYAGVELFRKRG